MKKSLLFIIIALLIITVSGCSSLSSIENRPTISVEGVGVVTVQPDIATLSITLSELKETTKEAQREVNEKMGRLLSIIKEAQVEERDIKTSSLQINPEYRYIDNEQVLVGQRVRQSISITVREIGKESTTLPTLLDSLGEISGISIGSIQFKRENSEDFTSQSRLLAMKSAHSQASELAKAASMKVGKPLKISEGSSNVPVVRALYSVVSSDIGSTELPLGEIEIRSSISVTYQLK